MTDNIRTIRDVYRLITNEGDDFSAIAIHAGVNRNNISYSAENLKGIAKTQEGQSVTLGHELFSVGTVTQAVWNEHGDDYGPYISVRFKIQNQADVLKAIKEKQITEVSTTTNYDKAWCNICEAEDGKCEHELGKLYDGKKAAIALNVTNFGPLALVDHGADQRSVILNEFIENKMEVLKLKLNELALKPKEEPIKKDKTIIAKASNPAIEKPPAKTLEEILGPPLTLPSWRRTKTGNYISWYKVEEEE
jgi:hypothetical protein